MARLIQGAALARSTTWLLARVVDPNTGSYISQAAVADVSYTVHDTMSGRKIAGANGLVIATAISDVLRTDKAWSKDAIGWNFGFAVPGDYLQAQGGYRVDCRFVPVSGATYYVGFQITTEKLYFPDP